MTRSNDSTENLLLAEKKCTRCGEIKKISCFKKRTTGRTRIGVQSECKACGSIREKARHAANRELINSKRRDKYLENRESKLSNYKKNRLIILDRQREYRKENKEKIAEHNRIYIKNNKEALKNKQNEYRRANKDKLSEKRKEWVKINEASLIQKRHEYYIANKDKHNEYSSINYSKNKDRHRVYRNNRRARKLNAGGKHSINDVKKLLALQQWMCACCRISIKESYHIDHIMPLAKGGTNNKENIQLLCPSCNLMKKDKYPIDFMQQQGFLL